MSLNLRKLLPAPVINHCDVLPTHKDYENTSKGPATLPTAKLLPMMLFHVGRWRSGTHSARMSVVPACIPAEPRPANARPRMKT
jgi:hypothetical protein